jgi:hypothetical protein
MKLQDSGNLQLVKINECGDLPHGPINKHLHNLLCFGIIGGHHFDYFCTKNAKFETTAEYIQFLNNCHHSTNNVEVLHNEILCLCNTCALVEAKVDLFSSIVECHI